MNTYETIRSVCTQTIRNFESIEPLLLDWKKSTAQVKKVVQSLIALDREEDTPDGYRRDGGTGDEYRKDGARH